MCPLLPGAVPLTGWVIHLERRGFIHKFLKNKLNPSIS